MRKSVSAGKAALRKKWSVVARIATKPWNVVMGATMPVVTRIIRIE
jgi:hypothetical protein